MILGNINGKTSTLEFSFLVRQEVNKFDYVQIPFRDNYVLAQILEIEKSNDTIAKCNILGYREDNKLKKLLSPLNPGIEVLKADEDFIKEILKISKKEYAGDNDILPSFNDYINSLEKLLKIK